MDFLKKHYEKLLLALLLVVFMALMFYLMGIIQETAKISREGLKLPTRDPDFEDIVKKEDMQFGHLERLKAGSDWQASAQKATSDGFDFVSDFVDIPGMARCAHCERIVPIQFFQNKSCPFGDCKQPLVTPPEDQGSVFKAQARTKEDPDGCGIPHRIKQKYGLSVEEADRENVLWDNDNDGFSNLYEYRRKTDMSNPLKHPPLWHRLVLIDIDNKQLDIVYKAINMQDGSTDQKTWIFQINNTKDKKLDDIYRKGDRLRFDIDGYYYKISEENITDPNKLKLVSADNDNAPEIVMEMNKVAYIPKPQIFLKDVGTGKNITIVPDRPFTMGNRKIGSATYKIVEWNREKGFVKLARRVGRNNFSSKTDMTVTKRGMIPVNERVKLDGNAPKKEEF